MTILITGGAGYIGSHVALALIEAGERVVVLDNLSTGRRRLVPPQAVFVQGEAGDQGLVAGTILAEGVREVIHLAGSIVVSDSVADPCGYYENNSVTSARLIQACEMTGVERFIFSSTAAVYGDGHDRPIRETDALRPASPYGRSKLMTEMMLQDAAAANGFSAAFLRYFNVAGADAKLRSGQVGRATHLVRLASQAALGRRDPIGVFGDDYDTPDGTCIRDYIHVSDLADAHVSLLRHLRAGGDGGPFNAGYGTGVSVTEICEAFDRRLGRPLKRHAAPRRQGDPAYLVADPGRLMAETGWRPRRADLDGIIASAMDWEASQDASDATALAA